MVKVFSHSFDAACEDSKESINRHKQQTEEFFCLVCWFVKTTLPTFRVTLFYHK